MRQASIDRPRVDARVVTAGWIALPFVVCSFVFLRYVLDSRAALLAAQAVFLAPLVLATAALAAASSVSRAGSRARPMWGLYAAATASVLVGEAALAFGLVAPRAAGIATALFDLGSASSIVLLLSASAVAGAFDRVGWKRTVRIVADGVALATLAFGVLFRFVEGRGLLATVGSGDVLRLTGYALIGVLLAEAGALIFGNTYALRAPWNRVLAAALAVIAAAVLHWSTVALGGGGSGAYSGAVSNVLYLAGYHLLLMTGLHRLAHKGRVWTFVPPMRVPAAWIGVATSSVVLGSVVWLIYEAFRSPAHSVARMVFMAAAVVATFCVIVRTALATAESFELDWHSTTDAVTGALGPRVLAAAWRALIEHSGRAGGVVCALVVDIDDFAMVNAARGFEAGDRCLRSVVRAIERVTGPDAWVMRFSGDEFVVLVHIANDSAARAMAADVCAVVRKSVPNQPVTASVGYSLGSSQDEGPEQLVRRASDACVWAKRQGKNRAIGYDERVGEASALGDRMTAGTYAGRDIARALLAAADARDPASRDHARNVAALSRMLAADVGLDPERVDHIEIAALLHDVGKIALPNVMLGGKTLSAKERTVAREHPRLGARLLEPLSPSGVPEWVAAHHERWDGSGYPDGLRERAIPLEARIIALADAYDGMTAGRRYGAPMSKAAALQEIDLGMGTRFDPDLSERFIELVGTTDSLGWSDDRVIA